MSRTWRMKYFCTFYFVCKYIFHSRIIYIKASCKQKIPTNKKKFHFCKYFVFVRKYFPFWRKYFPRSAKYFYLHSRLEVQPLHEVFGSGLPANADIRPAEDCLVPQDSFPGHRHRSTLLKPISDMRSLRAMIVTYRVYWFWSNHSCSIFSFCFSSSNSECEGILRFVFVFVSHPFPTRLKLSTKDSSFIKPV